MDCSVARTLDVVGEWWTLLIIRDAFLGARHFEEFQRRTGIARNILAERLERLVENGVFERRPYQERPLRHEYRLTEKGRELFGVLTALRQWGDRWAQAGAPPVKVEHLDCGHERTACTVAGVQGPGKGLPAPGRCPRTETGCVPRSDGSCAAPVGRWSREE